MKLHQLIYLSVSTIFGLVSTGCSEADEPMENQSSDDFIIFGTPWIDSDATVGDFSRGGTRANLLNSIDQFDVWGYCVSRSASDASKDNPDAARLDWNTKSNFFTAGADVFNKTRVKSDGGYMDYRESLGQLRKWNANEMAQYTFIGTSVIEGSSNAFSMAASSSASANAHGPQLTFTLPTNSNNIRTVLNHNDQPDALIAYTFDHTKAKGKVPMKFSHIMIGLRFMFHNYADDELKISKITFQGKFHKQVTIDFSSNKPDFVLTNSTYQGTFALFDSRDNPQIIKPESENEEGVKGVQGVLLGTDDDPVTLLLLPNRHPVLNPNEGQDKELILGDNKSIAITYDLGEGVKNKTVTISNFELNYIPQENSLHTAHFNFVGNKFVLMFQADNETNWENGSETNIDIQ